jgi:NAD(P)H-hydrate epimerase
MQAHKGTFGTALIIAGSVNYTGAAHLAGHAAYRVGAGLVKMAIPGLIYSALAGQFPEAVWLLLPHEMGVIKSDSAKIVQQNLDHVTAILMGPGWGLDDTTKEFLEKMITGKMQSEKSKSGIGFVMMDVEVDGSLTGKLPPLVIDADGLKLLTRIKNWEQCLPKNSILTPHPGEMSILTEMPIQEIQNKRLETANKYAELWSQVVVLKGALTVVASADGRLCVIPVASPALARAGTGDVLAGIITGLVAQGIEPYEAAVAGVWIHAQAGIDACERVGHPAAVLAGDVLDAIPHVLARLG